MTLSSGKLVGAMLIASAVVAGAALYWLQVYAFYQPVPAEDLAIALVPVAGEDPEPIPVQDVRAIDASSSPIRFRACFATPLSHASLTETFQLYDGAEPLTAPGWFDCFDAAEIGGALERGTALAFLSIAGVAEGVDRVVAILDDGRGYAWHQLQPGYGD